MTVHTLKGREVLRQLARCYRQLYLVPGCPETEEKYNKVVYHGMDIPENDLPHFLMSEEDRYETVKTPAGAVPVLTLFERHDFEMFLWIMANKGVPYDVPVSQGAAILDGLISWHRRGDKKEWRKDVLIILTDGQYSNIPSFWFGYDDREWGELSRIIRKTHECTHFFCRRQFPDRIDAVWDEIVADAAGLTAACGRYDLKMAAAFLGVSREGYTGGRLENYTQPGEDLDSTARKVWSVLVNIQNMYDGAPEPDVFRFVMLLEGKQDEWW